MGGVGARASRGEHRGGGALANKNARTAWALLRREHDYHAQPA